MEVNLVIHVLPVSLFLCFFFFHAPSPSAAQAKLCEMQKAGVAIKAKRGGGVVDRVDPRVVGAG